MLQVTISLEGWAGIKMESKPTPDHIKTKSSKCQLQMFHSWKSWNKRVVVIVVFLIPLNQRDPQDRISEISIM